MINQQASHVEARPQEALVNSLYNATANGLEYQLTFFEFSSSGCPACKPMESVLEKIFRYISSKQDIILAIKEDTLTIFIASQHSIATCY